MEKANALFLGIMAAAIVSVFWWGFKTLPKERWQIIASVPVRKTPAGHWLGVNLTYYGLLSASAYVFAVSLMIILTGSVGVPLWAILAVVLAVLSICMPAARILARLIEKKAFTFTVGGASFTGLLIAPPAIWIIDQAAGRVFGFAIPLVPVIAAMAIAYSFGEGIGRLACISFGCCYGKPLAGSHPVVQRIFRNHYFIFSGKNKKIAYEGGLDGQKVVPVQAVTAVLYVAAGLIGIHLFLQSYFAAAFLLTVIVTQSWRAVSETLRADYRGKGKMTAYQLMGLWAIVYAVVLLALLPEQRNPEAYLPAGLQSFWNPAMILFLILFWLVCFLYTGLSKVTGSTLSIHTHLDRI